MSEDLKLITGTADFLLKYGFLGTGLALVAIIPPFLWKRARVAAYVAISAGLAFIIAFGTLDLARQYFPSLITSNRAFLSGRILKVPDGTAIQIGSDQWRAGQAFLKRENDPAATGLFNQLFLLASRTPPKCLTIAIASSRNDAGQEWLFDIEGISTEDLRPDVEILAKLIAAGPAGPHLDLWRERAETPLSEPAVIAPVPAGQTSCFERAQAENRPPSLFGIGSAFAQPAPPMTPEDIARALDSDDLFQRRRARTALAAKGPSAFPQIEQLLNAPSPRQQLGALEALAQMPPANRTLTPAAIRSRAEALAQSPDETMRHTAGRALSR